jgi:CheY-like chemotaxis protein
MSTPSTPSILFVEDDRDIRELLIDALEDEGYSVLAAIDGLDAVERLRAHQAVPRLILLDLMMPRMSGAEFRNELLSTPAWSGIPIVVITADAQGRAKARALGAKDCLQKPVKLDRLFATIARVLGETRSSQQFD